MEITHRSIDTNGIKMHIAEAGQGPLVVMCHGWPESWYSWRHQLIALAEAGYHAVAPDQRGYGETECPHDIDQYTMLHLVGDLIGLLDALDEPTAVIAGHDWGAPVAWHAALLRPDRFHAVIGLSVPFRPRGPVRPTSVMPQTAQAQFYQLYFQKPGEAEAEFERDPRRSIRQLRYWGSGDAPRKPPASEQASANQGAAGSPANGAAGVSPANKAPAGMVPRGGGFLHPVDAPAILPHWLQEADVDYVADQFRKVGFRGGLNWYRNIDRNWELLAPWANTRVTVPALYVAGERDMVVAFQGMDKLLPALRQYIPQLREIIMLPECGHWTQQERPEEVNTAIIGFLKSLD